MKLTVRFFGQLAELTGENEKVMEVPSGISVAALKKQIANGNDLWQASTFLVAVNQSVVEDKILSDGDEVAFLPPFAGG